VNISEQLGVAGPNVTFDLAANVEPRRPEESDALIADVRRRSDIDESRYVDGTSLAARTALWMATRWRSSSS